MALDLQAAYHFRPLDAKRVGKLCKKYGGTVLLSTPTFLRGYLRRCQPDELGVAANEFSVLSRQLQGISPAERELSVVFGRRSSGPLGDAETEINLFVTVFVDFQTDRAASCDADVADFALSVLVVE